MYLYNYSGLKSRDTKIYSIGGYNVAGGFSVQFLTVVGPVFLLALIIGIIIKQGCKNNNQNLTDSPANLKLIAHAAPKNKYKKIK